MGAEVEKETLRIQALLNSGLTLLVKQHEHELIPFNKIDPFGISVQQSLYVCGLNERIMAAIKKELDNEKKEFKALVAKARAAVELIEHTQPMTVHQTDS